MRGRIAGLLLVLVSAGYFAVAADQSHNVPAARELSTELAGLTQETPSPVQQAVYRVPIPDQAENVAFYEANSWTKDTLYVQFTTTRDGLAAFLRQLGAGPADLHPGLRAVSIPAALAAKVPWTFPAGGDWAGMTSASPSPRPSHAITVDLGTPDRPTVFVASVIRFPSR
ncbi:hypothetical protein [Actinacidiphila rubida]|nr:hypothetical protein [Actinacidiphila rubida]